MIYPEADKLENWGSKFALVTLAARRAKQIKSGAAPLVDTASRNPLTIALEEIAAGKITCVVADFDAVLEPTVAPEVAELLAIPLETEEEEEAEAAGEVAAEPAEAAVAHEEDEEEEEEEEEEHDVWKAALEEHAEEVAVVEPPADLDVDHVEPVDLAALPDEEAKPKRGRRKKASVDEDIVPLDAVDPEIILAEAGEVEEE